MFHIDLALELYQHYLLVQLAWSALTLDLEDEEVSDLWEA